MNYSELRSSSKSEEIRTFFSKYSKSIGKGLLWQSTDDGDRNYWSVVLEDSKKKGKLFSLKVLSKVSIHKVYRPKIFDLSAIDPSRPIYFRGEHDETLFKMDPGEFIYHDKSIHCCMPFECFLKENRENNRLKFHEDFHVSLKMSGGAHQVSFKCNNFGHGGIGLISSKKNICLFKRDSYIFINSLGKLEILKGFKGRLVHKSDNKDGTFQVGLAFINPLNDYIFKRLRNLLLEREQEVL